MRVGERVARQGRGGKMVIILAATEDPKEIASSPHAMPLLLLAMTWMKTLGC